MIVVAVPSRGGEEEDFDNIFALFNFLFPLASYHRIKMLQAASLHSSKDSTARLRVAKVSKKVMCYLCLLPWTPYRNPICEFQIQRASEQFLTERDIKPD